MQRITLVTIFLFNISLLPCQQDIRTPVKLTDGWEIANLTTTDMDATMIRKVMEKARTAEPFDLRGLVVVKDDKLVLDEYYNSFYWENILDIRSAGKSLTGLLAMIAIEKGLFETDTKVITLFPKYAGHQHPSEWKNSITIEHLLTMSSGLDADVDRSDSPGNEMNWLGADDYVKLILDLPMIFQPGERYIYSSASAMLLGAAIEVTSGQTLEEFALKHLFGPMEFRDLFWQKTPAGRTAAMGNLYLRPRDMAKIGYLIASHGTWKGRRILTAESIDKLTGSYQEITNYYAARSYGYLWYHQTLNVDGQDIEYVFASGNGGNKIFVVPSLNLVVAVGQTAYGYGYGHRRAEELFELLVNSCF